MNLFKTHKLVLVLFLSCYSNLLGEEWLLGGVVSQSKNIFIAKYIETRKDGFNVYRIEEELKGNRKHKIFEWPSPLVINRGKILVFERRDIQSVFELSKENVFSVLSENDGEKKVVTVNLGALRKLISKRME